MQKMLITDACQFAFALTQHYEDIKNHHERVSDINPFLNPNLGGLFRGSL